MNPEVKKRLIECGYDYGFECPVLTSNDPYPDYIRENVAECIEKIKAVQNDDTFTFAFMTDLHYLPLAHHKVLLERNINAYSDIVKETGCDRLLLGGDYVIDSPRELKMAGYKELAEAFEPFGYLPCNGNHDNGNLWDAFMEREKPLDKLTRREIYDVFYSTLSKRGAKFNDKHFGLYYYVDDNKNMARYIFIDICDTPEYYDEQIKGMHCLSQSQIDWLINDALVTEYDIILDTHSVLRPAITDEEEKLKNGNRRLEVLNIILDAYKNGEKISGSFYEDELKIEVNADFSKIFRGDIIAVMVGHFHQDYTMHTSSGIPYIATSNFFMAECHEPRSVGDKTELLFDIVTVNRSTRTLYVTRIGSGDDRIINY